MKLPFTFGTKLIFRLVFPGLILTAIFAPLIHTLLAWAFAGSGLEVPDLAALSLEVVLWGWLVVLADQPIYMLYEGRRWWPRVLLQSGRRREERRLAKLRRNADASMRLVDADLYRESGVELLKFPIGDDWEPRAMYPTRLGNLLTAYETHASRMYKLDAIFYWPRLWIALDKDLREEVDNHQAVADSGVYVSFALWLACVMALFYAAYNALLIRALQHPQLKLDYTPPASVLLALSAISALLAYGVYRLSLFAQEQYGELFKALFDQFRSKLSFVDATVEQAIKLGGNPVEAQSDENAKYRIASRYLRWHQIRPEKVNVSPGEWQKELLRRQSAAKPRH